MSEAKKFTGRVVWFSSRTGIGFLAPDDGSKDLFIHFSNILCEGFKTLKPDQIVEYELGENHRGPQAINVRIIRDVE